MNKKLTDSVILFGEYTRANSSKPATPEALSSAPL